MNSNAQCHRKHNIHPLLTATSRRIERTTQTEQHQRQQRQHDIARHSRMFPIVDAHHNDDNDGAQHKSFRDPPPHPVNLSVCLLLFVIVRARVSAP